MRIIWIEDVGSREVEGASEAFFLCIFTLLLQGGIYFTGRVLFCFGAREKAYMVYRHQGAFQRGRWACSMGGSLLRYHAYSHTRL